MTENFTNLTLTVNGDPNIAVAYAKQGDKNASGVVVTMVDDDGTKISISTSLININCPSSYYRIPK